VRLNLRLRASFISINGHEERKLPLTTEQKDILKSFQSDYTRLAEEQFAQILTERGDVRLFFINENRCFTDGKNIIIDPSERELFIDKTALLNAEKHLNMNNRISSEPLVALKMQTRASNIHESLHILYSNFPLRFLSDKRASNEIRTLILSDINNIIEDAFIEAVGCSLYDNLEHYLLWNRIALFYTKADTPDTIEHKFEVAGIKIDTKVAYENIETSGVQTNEISLDNNNIKKFKKIIVYLNYMGFFLLYPFFNPGGPPEPIFEYVEKTKNIFLEGAQCGNATKRETYTLKIFDIIEPLIPDDSNIDLPPSLKYLLDNLKANYSSNSSFCNNFNEGKEVVITRRLFTNENGEPIPFDSIKNKLEKDTEIFLSEKENLQQLQKNERSSSMFGYNNFDCSNLHKNIKLEVIKPKININLKRAYQNMVSKYQLIINSYSSQISQYLKMNIEEMEEKKLFGSGLSSRNFGDPKKRFWHRKNIIQGIPDIGFLFLVDGSGSMEGERMNGVIATMVIIHEIFRNNNIQHSIVEHRAIYDEPKLIHNILVDFQHKTEEKYNILCLDASEGTREGFSLYWAEKHLNKNCSSEYKIIIMISDGAPAHACDDPIDYIPPISIKDTAKAAKKIIRRGTSIVALALDTPDDDECYQQLKMIYPHVVSCVDMGKFTGQLLHIVSKLFQEKIG
jgi:hypothetical protein